MNPDEAVLRNETQNPTHVTPHIAQLAQGLFLEQLQVIGPRSAALSRAEQNDLNLRQRISRNELEEFVRQSARSHRKVVLGNRDRRIGRSVYVRSIEIDKKLYQVRRN
jgi:DNA (cytosine-5)-methyltransferase 1